MATNPTLSLQLWSLRHETAADPIATLKTIPSLGFDGVELAGTYGIPAAEWKSILAELDLSVVGAHVGLGDLEDRSAELFAFHAAVGNRRLIVPSLPGDLQNAEGYKKAAVRLNRIAGIANDAGFFIGYHNHAFEFAPLPDGTCGMDILLAETDPTAVKFEFDVFWLERGGQSAVPFLKKHASRGFVVHAKELDRATGNETILGEGGIDFPAIVTIAKQQKWPVVLEYEGAEAPAAVKKGAAYLRSL